MSLRAFAAMSGDHLTGGPSRWPRFLAAARPALVRSRIRSRSNWADGPKNVHHELARRPLRAHAILDRAEMNAALLELRQQLGHVHKAATYPVELAGRQRVALLEGGECLGEHRPIVANAARLFHEDIGRLDAELARCVELQVELLSCRPARRRSFLRKFGHSPSYDYPVRVCGIDRKEPGWTKPRRAWLRLPAATHCRAEVFGPIR